MLKKSESICKHFDKNYIKFQQINMKLYTTITDLEFSTSFVNLFIGLLVQRFLEFSSKGVLLHIAGHHFGHLKLPCRCFMLITSRNLPVFVKGIHTFIADFYHLLVFTFKNVVGFITSFFTTQVGNFFHFVFSGHNEQFQ